MKGLRFELTIIFFIIMFMFSSVFAITWIDFDDIPVNGLSEIPNDALPGSFVEWRYSSVDHYTGRDYFGSAGWFNPDPNQITIDEEAIYMIAPDQYQNAHMGYGTFGYLDIVDNFCMSGNCMKYTITGAFSPSSDGEDHCGEYGKGYPCDIYGTYYESKTGFLNLESNPNYDGSKGNYQVGRFKWYLGNGDMAYHTPLPITTSAHNRMSYYFYLNGDATPMQMAVEGVPAESVSYAAPFQETGGHWYHYGLNHVLGGWTHYYIDEHPSYSNSWGGMQNSPLPLGAMRTYRAQYPSNMGYWESMYHFYHSSGRINQPVEINGLALPESLPNACYLDDIAFIEDTEPQNEETIQGVALTYIYDTEFFWLGFTGKYKHACNINYATYEIRYRIGSEITNANWDSSTKADIVDVPEFSALTSVAEGVVTKDVSCRSGLLVRFKVKPEDQPSLVEGTSLWVAIKDVSQDPSDDHLPNPATGYNGRNYNTHPDLDYEYDHPAMQLIKRIPYTLGPENMGQGSTDCVDEDNDGYGVGMDCLGLDCDDSNSSIRPGASEVCGNGIDEDCSGVDLECGVDLDSDGYNFSVDCDDSNSSVHALLNCSYDGASCGNFSLCALSCPSVPVEVCGNGVDEDCDGADLNCSFHEADLDFSGVVETDELVAYVERWKVGEVSIQKVMESVVLWGDARG